MQNVLVLPRSSLVLTLILYFVFHPEKAEIGLYGLYEAANCFDSIETILLNFKHCGGTLLNLEGERKQFSLVKKCSLTFFYY